MYEVFWSCTVEAKVFLIHCEELTSKYLINKAVNVCRYNSFHLLVVCCWLCCVPNCEPSFYLCFGDFFRTGTEKNIECVICLEVTLCSWWDVQILIPKLTCPTPLPPPPKKKKKICWDSHLNDMDALKLLNLHCRSLKSWQPKFKIWSSTVNVLVSVEWWHLYGTWENHLYVMWVSYILYCTVTFLLHFETQFC